AKTNRVAIATGYFSPAVDEAIPAFPTTDDEGFHNNPPCVHPPRTAYREARCLTSRFLLQRRTRKVSCARRIPLKSPSNRNLIVSITMQHESTKQTKPRRKSLSLSCAPDRDR